MPRRKAYSGVEATVAAKARDAQKRAADALPSLYMHIYAAAEGVRVHAFVDRMDHLGRLQRLEIAQVTFRPPAVTEMLVVEWGQRCLAKWLRDQVLGTHEREAT
jgi:hypothetical protein